MEDKKQQRELLAEIMRLDELSGLYEEPKYRLTKSGFIKESEDVMWLEFHEDGTFKKKFDEIAIGRSLLMSPFNVFFTWQTTEVTEILEQKENYVKFKTLNSTYELFKL